MTIEEWLETRMEQKGIKTQSILSDRAGVSQPTISIGKKRGSFSKKTMKKLEAVLGPYDPDEEAPKKITDEEFFREASTTPEESLSRFRGKSCPTSSKLCRACWEQLKEQNVSLPFGRAVCRLRHGWVLEGGILFYLEEDGTKVPEEQL